ncbi:hypothetical protein KEM55_002438 [Ascosphaera atra]|nr:hypothetical protein KEM55_002438 [Ascosphaera atra]
MDLSLRFQPMPLSRYAGHWIFLNFTTHDFDQEDDMRSARDDDDSDSVPHEENVEGTVADDADLTELLPLQSTSFGHPLASYLEVEGNLLDYFIRVVSPHCSLSSSDNPYLHFLTPLALHFDTTRHAILAAAANQLCLLGDARYQKAACLYKHKALVGLRKDIENGCINDEGCTSSWITHLRGGLQLVEAVKSAAKSRGPSSFFMMYFVAHEIMGRTATEKWSENSMSLSWCEGEDLDVVDMTMGCSRALMTYIDSISNLAKEKASILKTRLLTSQERDYFSQASERIKAGLLSLSQRLPEHSAGRDELMRLAETKRLAALLYLQGRLSSNDSMEVDEPEALPLTTAAQRSAAYRASPTSSKRHIIQSIISLISTVPDNATLLWPLYVLGNAGLDDEEHRRFVLDRLNNIQKTRNLGSVRLAKLAVQQAFRERDLRHPRGRTWGNDKFGLISLA